MQALHQTRRKALTKVIGVNVKCSMHSGHSLQHVMFVAVKEIMLGVGQYIPGMNLSYQGRHFCA